MLKLQLGKGPDQDQLRDSELRDCLPQAHSPKDATPEQVPTVPIGGRKAFRKIGDLLSDAISLYRTRVRVS